MFEVIENKENKTHLDFWNGVANAPVGQQHDWNEVFEKYTATVDNPACCVWRELLEAYPDAKVLVTLHPRGPEAWYESTIDTIYFTESMWQFKLLKLITKQRCILISISYIDILNPITIIFRQPKLLVTITQSNAT